MPFFSVIVPIYNTRPYLEECLGSVLRQDYDDLELLLINDSSTDGCGKYCDLLAEKHTNVRVVHHKSTRGVAESRNSGIDIAIGSYVLFLDSDDYLLDDSLAGMKEEIRNSGSPDVLIGRYTGDHPYENNDYFFDLKRRNVEALLTHIVDTDAHPNYCWQFVINRDFMTDKRLFFIKARIAEDQEFVVRLLCLMDSVLFYDKVFYWQRVRPGSLSGTRDLATSTAFLAVATELAKFWSYRDWSHAKRHFIYSRVRYVVALFSASLIMHDRQDIQMLSEHLEKTKESMLPIQISMGEIPLYCLSERWGSYFGLLMYRQFVIERTVNLIRNSPYSERYLFCVGEYTGATANILLNEGYSIKGVLDNNVLLDGTCFSGLRVRTPSFLSTIKKPELSQIAIIVCNESASIYREIRAQLKELGIEQAQVLHKVFD